MLKAVQTVNNSNKNENYFFSRYDTDFTMNQSPPFDKIALTNKSGPFIIIFFSFLKFYMIQQGGPFFSLGCDSKPWMID